MNNEEFYLLRAKELQMSVTVIEEQTGKVVSDTDDESVEEREIREQIEREELDPKNDPGQ